MRRKIEFFLTLISLLTLCYSNIFADVSPQNDINNINIDANRMHILYYNNVSRTIKTVNELRFGKISIRLKKIRNYLNGTSANDGVEYNRAFAYFSRAGEKSILLFLSLIEAIRFQNKFMKLEFNRNRNLKQALLQRNANEKAINLAIEKAVEQFNNAISSSVENKNSIQEYYLKDLLFVSEQLKKKQVSQEEYLKLLDNGKDKKIFLSLLAGVMRQYNYISGFRFVYYPNTNDNSVSGFGFNMYIQNYYYNEQQLLLNASILYCYKYYSISPLHNLHLALGLDLGIKLKGQVYYAGLNEKFEYNHYYGGMIFEIGYLYIAKNQKFTLSLDIVIGLHSRIFNRYRGTPLDEDSPFSAVFDCGIRFSIGFNLF